MAVSKALIQEQQAELDALAMLPDERIDVSAAPEVRGWVGARRGLFHRPAKQQLTLRLDAEVVAWFKARGKRGYQARINAALREYIRQHGNDGEPG